MVIFSVSNKFSHHNSAPPVICYGLLGIRKQLKKFQWLKMFKSLKLADYVVDLADAVHNMDVVF